jgi:hypothetical protein
MAVAEQSRSENRSLGATEDKAAVAAARQKSEFARVQGVDLTVKKGTRYGQPQELPKLKGLENAATAPPPTKIASPSVAKPPTPSAPKTSGPIPEQLELPFEKGLPVKETKAQRLQASPTVTGYRTVTGIGGAATNIARVAVPGVVEAEAVLGAGAVYAYTAGYATVGAALETGAVGCANSSCKKPACYQRKVGSRTQLGSGTVDVGEGDVLFARAIYT